MKKQTNKQTNKNQTYQKSQTSLKPSANVILNTIELSVPVCCVNAVAEVTWLVSVVSGSVLVDV